MEITAVVEFVFELEEYADPNRIYTELYGKEVTLDLRGTELEELFGAPKYVEGFVEDVEVDG